MSSEKSVIETTKTLAEQGSARAKVKESTRRRIKANFRDKDELVEVTYSK